MRVCVFGDAQSVHIQQLVPGLLARGLSVHVVTHKPAAIAGATVERFAVPPPGLKNLRGWENRHREYLRRFLRDFDVVNVHFLYDWGFCGAGPGSVSREEVAEGCVVATAWGSDIVDPPGETAPTPDLIRTRIAFLRSASAVTTCGSTFAKTVAEYACLPRDQIDVLPFGVNLDLFRSGGAVHAARQPIVGFFKGFREVYGPECLIASIPRVLAEVPSLLFEMVGDGPMLSKCQALARELGVHASISWIPRQPHLGLPRYLRRWAVSVIPSVHEAFGVAALESSAMELPVVASNVGGLRDTVRHGQTGLLVPALDPNAMADAIVRLLKDTALRERFGRAGRRMVEAEFDWTSLYPRWVALYESARERRCCMV